MEEVSCRLCKGHEHRVIASKEWRGLQFPIVQCTSCGLYYCRIQPTLEELGAIYEGYDSHHEKQWDDLQDGFNVKLVKLLKKLSNSGGTLLDLGAGTGKFLSEAQDRGYHVMGVEPIKEACRTAHEKYGIAMVPSTLEDYLAATNDQFDIITLLNVFEHLPDPLEVLRMIHRRLKDGGLCVLVVPNTDFTLLLGFVRRLFRSRDPYLLYAKKFGQQAFNPPYHLTAFTPRGLRATAHKAGFRRILIRNAPVISTNLHLKNAVKYFVTGLGHVMYLLSFRKLLISHSLFCILTKTRIAQ
jgi:2-polyprenyl-3-methyl-5-hydroxy-6-metoxy-1,4-benzoquinol methylase